MHKGILRSTEQSGWLLLCYNGYRKGCGHKDYPRNPVRNLNTSELKTVKPLASTKTWKMFIPEVLL